MRNWPVAYSGCRPGDQPMTDFGVRTLPGPSVLGGQNLAMASSTDNPAAAQELIRFLTSEESELRLFRDGGFAAPHRGVREPISAGQAALRPDPEAGAGQRATATGDHPLRAVQQHVSRTSSRRRSATAAPYQATRWPA